MRLYLEALGVIQTCAAAKTGSLPVSTMKHRYFCYMQLMWLVNALL